MAKIHHTVPVGAKIYDKTILSLPIKKEVNQSNRITTIIFYECKCDCGEIITISFGRLTKLKHKTCNCAVLNGKKGYYKDKPLIHTYRAMISRCYNPKDISYPKYGARGITVCERWLNSVDDFYEDMGDKPIGDYSLDRKDVNKGYSKENCKWATRVEQNNNKTTTFRVTYKDKEYTALELTKLALVCRTTLIYRIKAGWDIEKALFTPVR